MHIDLFWIFLTLSVYLFLLIYSYFRGKQCSGLSKTLLELKHKHAEVSNFLTIFSKNLQTVEEIDDSMKLTAHYVADLIGARSLCVFIKDEEGFLRASGVAGAFPPLNKSSERILTKPRYLLESLKKEKICFGDGFIGRIAQTGEAETIDDASQLPMFANSPIPIESIMGVPMVHEGKVIGVICAVNNAHVATAFTPEQFNALKFMSAQVVLAQNIIKVYADLSKQQRIQQELNFARQLQASLLPEEPPPWGIFDIKTFSKPAKEVSGDFYDFVDIDDDRLLVVIADACGKGIPACMLMAMTRSFIRASAERFTTLQAMMGELNNYLFSDSGDERFITVSCCLLDKKEQTVEYARAGHTELLVGRRGHPVRKIFPDGAALGLLPNEIAGEFDLLNFSFFDDMTLLLFSDGITEALNAAGEEFGVEPLIEIFQKSANDGKGPKELIESILLEVHEFTMGTLQADDQTIVVISSKQRRSKGR
ncbi:MAG: SpoIIE family protein phosphatase [Kiritimatiellaeota bacterium]|nr:SpoIIE family protein phosphatase [Kiritimatiellota bacterium]